MDLFNKVPPNLFVVLSSPLKHTYASLLMKVYKQSQINIYTLDREVVIDLFCEYLETNQTNEKDMEQEFEEVETETRKRAFQFLNRLIEVRWLKQEHDYSRRYQISVPDYASEILSVFNRILTGQKQEFSGLVIAIYQHMAAEIEGDAVVNVENAYLRTLELNEGLTQLNHNIEEYVEGLYEIEDVKDVLDNIFNDYEKNILGGRYYRLKSSDHISKYRPKILEKVRGWKRNSVLIREQAAMLIKSGRDEDQIHAENRIYGWLQKIEDSFMNMTDMLDTIDRRNTQYVRVARHRINLFLESDTVNTKAQLNNVLKNIGSMAIKEGEKQHLPTSLQKMINLSVISAVDENSVYKPRVQKKKPKAIKVKRKTIDHEQRKLKRDAFKKHVSKTVTPTAINEHVSKVMQNSHSRHLSEMPQQTGEEWSNLIYTVLYGREEDMSYQLAYPGSKGDVVESEIGMIPNIVLERKETSD
ncbi:DUF5716 family protein [Rossellomorea aquimaris]|nr:DUF5716 family protein [Rossellomorea aquimaris]